MTFSYRKKIWRLWSQKGIYRNQNGAALVIVQAINAAQAGLDEAKARLGGPKTASHYVGDPAASVDPWWSSYIVTSTSFPPSDDPSFDSAYRNYIPTTSDHTTTSVASNSLQSDISYLVKIRHKREFDAEQRGHTTAAPHYYDGDGDSSSNTQASPGNIIYYGAGDPTQPAELCQFTGSSVPGAWPVEIITAYGKMHGAFKPVEIEVVRPSPPPITSTMYSKQDITFNGGASQKVYGADNCASSNSLPPAYIKEPGQAIENSTPDYNGDPDTPQTGSVDINIDDYVKSMKDSAEVIITSDQNNGTYGDSTNFVICYSNTSDPANVNGLKLSNVTGYGILLVEGDLTLGGGFNWNGLLLVTGTLTFNGGGAGINILGAILANETIDINGGLDIRYDSCAIDDSFTTLSMKTKIYRDNPD